MQRGWKIELRSSRHLPHTASVDKITLTEIGPSVQLKIVIGGIES